MSYLNKETVLAALLNEGSVYVRLDASYPGASLPKQHRENTELLLEIGYSMVIPIPDLVADKVGISGTLSFGRAPYFCLIPWAAVYGAAATQGASPASVSWPQPKAKRTVEPPERERKQTGETKSAGKHPHLRLV